MVFLTPTQASNPTFLLACSGDDVSEFCDLIDDERLDRRLGCEVWLLASGKHRMLDGLTPLVLTGVGIITSKSIVLI